MRIWLKTAREACGLTMKGAAEKLDISESYYSMIESGTRQKTLDISLASKISLLFDMLNACSGVSDSFESLYIGEFLWMDGHCGLYIGDGLAVECTPIWADGVQITAVGNMGTKDGYQTRTWQKHGKLPYVTYEATPEEKPAQKPVTQPESEDLYLVWAGAFTSREEAEAFARELAAAGPFTPVISTVNEIPEGDVLPDPEPEAEAIQEGDAVYIRPGATDYNGGGLWEGVYGRVSQAFQIRGDRVVVTYNGVTVAAVNIKDLIKA